MLFIESKSNSPYFNLATEEFLLKKSDDNIIFLYINSPSVILGKHQNTLKEINYQYIKRHEIPVCRRISGGGTVYHDEGNINFCFITNGEIGKLVNFEKQVQPILRFLDTLGLSAEFKGHNDLRLNGYKISGNAEHVFKQRVLHHGTLLFDSNLSALNESIKDRKLKIDDKAVNSVRTVVKNITEILSRHMSLDDFYSGLKSFLFQKYYSGLKLYELTSQDISEIDTLVKDKFSTWEWNYGYSPGYSLSNSFISEQKIDFTLDVKKGIINRIEFFPSDNILKELQNKLTGLQHRESVINDLLKCFTDLKRMTTQFKEEFLNALF